MMRFLYGYCTIVLCLIGRSSSFVSRATSPSTSKGPLNPVLHHQNHLSHFSRYSFSDSLQRPATPSSRSNECSSRNRFRPKEIIANSIASLSRRFQGRKLLKSDVSSRGVKLESDRDEGRKRARSSRSLPLAVLSLSGLLLTTVRRVTASAGPVSLPSPSSSSSSSTSPLQGSLLWLALFLLSAVLHSAESAITKISPWKVREFAEEEGEDSPFATLSSNLTRLLSTILLTTTACSIYGCALFVATATQLFPSVSLGAITAALTVITLFFGELIPKALAVANSELVARKTVPFLSAFANLLMPLTSFVTFCSDLVLSLAGLRNEEDKNVSEDMLRMVVAEATKSTEGIETGEGRMIKNVLDMQDKAVEKIMQPRIEMVALPDSAPATTILQTAIGTKYSRIPIYRGGIDNIIGVVFSKDLLYYTQVPSTDTHSATTSLQMQGIWSNLTAAELMEPTYFIPETMSTWNALQEMKKRRVHMAIVVDEYGGTSGLVTFEDLLEEVVGEIYDEDDDVEESEDLRTIFIGPDGSVNMKGSAELGDVAEALKLQLDEETLGEYSTIGGLLCSKAGEIPHTGDRIVLSEYCFTVREVDERRILAVSAEEAAGLPDGWKGDWEGYKLEIEKEKREREEKDKANSGRDDSHDSRERERERERGIGSGGGGSGSEKDKDVRADRDKDNRDSFADSRSPVRDINSLLEGDQDRDGWTFRDGEWVDPNAGDENASSPVSAMP